MTATVRTEFVGASDAIKALRKIDPDLRKEFTRQVKDIAAPIVNAAKAAYPDRYLSGMTRKWSPRGRAIFPYDARKARSGVSAKVNTRRGAHSVIAVTQKDPAASVIDMAGKKTANPLGQRLDQYGRPSRVMWPSAEANIDKVQQEMSKAVTDVMKQVSREVG